MKNKKLSITLTPHQYLLLNTYQVLILEKYGERRTKQQIFMELLWPILQQIEDGYTFGGAE